MILLKEIVLPVSAKISLTPSRPTGYDLNWEKSTYIIMMGPYSRELLLMTNWRKTIAYVDLVIMNIVLSSHPLFIFFNLQNLTYFFSIDMTLQSRYVNM